MATQSTEPAASYAAAPTQLKAIAQQALRLAPKATPTVSVIEMVLQRPSVGVHGTALRNLAQCLTACCERGVGEAAVDTVVAVLAAGSQGLLSYIITAAQEAIHTRQTIGE